MLGTRELLKLEDWAAKNHATQIGDFATCPYQRPHPARKSLKFGVLAVKVARP
jgi:hypothetical protein